MRYRIFHWNDEKMRKLCERESLDWHYEMIEGKKAGAFSVINIDEEDKEYIGSLMRDGFLFHSL